MTLLRGIIPSPLVTPVPPDIAARLDVDRATVLANMFRVIAIAGLNIMGLWMVDFGNGVLHDIVRGLLACGAAVYCMILFRGEVWLRANPATRQPSTYLWEMLILVIALGLIWGILLTTLMSIADASQHALVYAMIVAGMSTAVLVAPLSISIAFWLPVTAGAYVSMFVSSQPFDPFALVCLASYTVLTGFSAIYLNNKLTERAISAIRVEENSEVIKLLLRDFEESTSDWLWETDASMQLRRISARLAQVAGRAPDQIIGRFPESLLGDIARMEVRGASPVHRLKALIEQRAAFRDVVIPVTIDGEERFWSLTGKPVLDKSGAFAGYHGVGSDITAQRRSQEQIAFLARHDSLTKLPNRVLFNEALHQSCDRCEAQGLALLCLDLDDFKLVNDTMGHATGDGVLVAVGERIRGCLRDGDVAARLGGDEFAVILVQTDPERTVMIAERIIDRVSRPYQFDGRLIQIGISIGISLAPQDGTTPSGLMKNADLALYRAKAEGRGIWRLYDPAMDERLQDRRTLQSDLRQAVLLGEFCIDYQPVVDLKAQRIVGAEALLRWMHPVRGLLSPAQFIPMAEDAGLIGAIGKFVLNEACRTAAGWPPHVSIAVNMSPLQFRDPGLVDVIDQALAASGVAPSRLELEITETTMLETSSETLDALWKLHGRGVRIALDDFGTGYSSLSYLRRFPFDKIKIDRTFIRDLGYEKDDSSIIMAIIGLADSMGMTVTAEGVETIEQSELLTGYGCAQGQGFLYYEPISAAAIDNVIAQDSRLPAAPPEPLTVRSRDSIRVRDKAR